MSQSSYNNKRIAKNTLLLYFRMLFLMLVSLYSSRIVLNTLGITDYGINNVVGGIIGMLGFITGSLSAASSRYITFDLGKGNIPDMKKTFGNILSIHYLLSIFVFLIGETVGVWFLNTQMQIPDDRYLAAFWVYQLSICSSIMSIISVPYNATIIAHERMQAFAYITISDAVLKLLIVYLLVVIPYDKLIVYAFLSFCIQTLDRIIYVVYCTRNFCETKAKCQYDSKLFREIFSFAGWTMNGTLAVVGYSQGLNMLLNVFFGPAVNAARGIAVQVQNICQQFCSNFQTALNPQLTKKYAEGDFASMHKLLIQSSKFSYYILFLIALPLMYEAPFVLHLWLGIVPEYTVSFLRLTLITGLLGTLSNPLIISIHATGKIRKFQIIEGTSLLMIVPVAYILLKFFSIDPRVVFITHIVVEMFTQVIRIRIVLPMIGLKIVQYFKCVVKPIITVTLIAPIIPSLCYIFSENNFLSFITICSVCLISLFIVVYFIGCGVNERIFINKAIGTFCAKMNILNK